MSQAGGGGGTAPEGGGGTGGNGSSGSTDVGGTDAGGTDAGGTDAGGTDTGGTDTGGTNAGGTAGTAGSAGSPPDLNLVRPTVGCGMAAPGDLVAQQYVKRSIETSGHKQNSRAPAACLPNGQTTFDWNITREYFVRLPSGYDPEKAYPLVLQTPRCETGSAVYPLPDIAEQVIQVSFSPATGNCQSSCFDIFDGDNSIEFPFYEGVWQQLAGELCFDQNRVFAAGKYDSGSVWANELGCVYAGHAKYPIRAIGSIDGGLPSVNTRPTCSQSPMPAIWLHGGRIEYWDFTRSAIEAAMQVNGCPGRYPGSEFWPDYEVPGLDPATCSRITSSCATRGGTCMDFVSCPASNPMALCSFGGNSPDLDTVANLSFSHFFSSFFAP